MTTDQPIQERYAALTRRVDTLTARAERAEAERDREHQKAIAYLQWRDHTAAIASTLVDAIDEWFGPPAGVGPVRKAAERMREVLTLDPEKTYGQNIPDVVTAPVPGSQIPLTRGLVALVDQADHDAITAAGSWCASPSYDGLRTYAKRSIRKPDGSKTTQFLHTFITGWPYVDHINGDGLDNRRVNLRPATVAQNNRNTRLSRNNASGFKGVHWVTKRSCWRACISVNGKNRHVGHFATAEEAARAYDAAARQHFGEYARLNFPTVEVSAASPVPSRRAQEPEPPSREDIRQASAALDEQLARTDEAQRRVDEVLAQSHREPTDDEIAAEIDRAQEEVEAEAQAHAQGYAEAVARLRDDERYRNWWTALPKQDPAYGYWQGPARRHLADYLETVGPDGIDVETGRWPAREQAVQPTGVHAWSETAGLSVVVVACTRCGIVQRRDGENGPCKGTGRVELRAQEPADLVFNAITEMLKKRDRWVPLSDRMACTEAALAALDGDETAAPKLAQGGRRNGCGPACSEGHTYEAGCAIKPPARAFLGERPCGKPGCPCGGTR